MKLPDSEEFNFKDVTIAGDDCWLITPSNMATKWTDDNARFRSCIVRKSDNFVVSQGFSKFTNFGEKPDFQPWDNSWKIEARHKLDGSLLIVSRYKGEWILRTRGTVDARQLQNGYEIDLLVEKYKNFFNDPERQIIAEKYGKTYLFEWVTPSNVIVLRESDEPKLIFLGMIDNLTCLLATQDMIDSLYLGFDRPQRYKYNSIEECILDVAAWKGKEGVVLYSPDGQTLKKIKADEYCELHKLATGIKGIKQVLDVFLASPKFVEEKEFYNYISTTLDFEIAEKCKDFIGEVTEAYGKFIHSVNTIERAMGYISKLDSRKKQAMAIQEHWDGWMVPVSFSLLDNKPLDDKLVKKSMEKLLEI
jgi:hypothetical protein